MSTALGISAYASLQIQPKNTTVYGADTCRAFLRLMHAAVVAYIQPRRTAKLHSDRIHSHIV